MKEPNTDVIQGTLDMLILKTLSLEPLHGFGIAGRIEQISRGVFKVNPGSLLTRCSGWNAADGWMPSGVERRTRVVLRSINSPGPGRNSLRTRLRIGHVGHRPSQDS